MQTYRIGNEVLRGNSPRLVSVLGTNQPPFSVKLIVFVLVCFGLRAQGIATINSKRPYVLKDQQYVSTGQQYASTNQQAYNLNICEILLQVVSSSPQAPSHPVSDRSCAAFEYNHPRRLNLGKMVDFAFVMQMAS